MTRAKTELFMTFRLEVPVFTAHGIRMVNRHRSRFLDVLCSKKRDKSPEASRNRPPQPPAMSRREGTSIVYSTQRSKGVPRGDDLSDRSNSSSRSPAFARSFATAPKSVSKYEGATDVLGQRKRSTFHRISRSITSTKVTSRRTSSTLKKTAPSPKVHQRHLVTQSQQSQLRETALLKKTKPLKAMEACNPPKSGSKKGDSQVDSTWFFPVGSQVMHNDLGIGTILPPQKGELTVCVQFDNGIKRDFPLHGTDISPVVSK